jgi:hypothetical protein
MILQSLLYLSTGALDSVMKHGCCSLMSKARSVRLEALARLEGGRRDGAMCGTRGMVTASQTAWV